MVVGAIVYPLILLALLASLPFAAVVVCVAVDAAWDWLRGLHG